jgi:hypothetical protein
MEAVRIKKKIESNILNIPVLKELIGKNVEIIMLIEPEKEHPFKEKKPADWRTKMKIQPKLLVEPDKIIEPAEEKTAHCGKYQRQFIAGKDSALT